MIEACLNPEMAAEITCQPVRRHGVDAAVFFSDIMVPLALAGVDVTIAPGVGPVIADPVRGPDDVEALVARRIEDGSAIERAVELAVRELGEATPVVGFAGAPFTLAAYLVEGRGSRDHLAARSFMHAEPAAWRRLMTWCAEISGRFLQLQVAGGARAVQLFDSWAGALSLDDYAAGAAPYSKLALAAVGDGGVAGGAAAGDVACDAAGSVADDGPAPDSAASHPASEGPGGGAGTTPRIHFGTGTGHLLEAMAACGCEAMGIDYRTPLDEAARRLPGMVLQGNIDPARLSAGWEVLAAHARDVVRRGRAAPAHIVNLGHGVPPGTDPAVLTDLVALVHDL